MKTLVTFADEGVNEQFVIDTMTVYHSQNEIDHLICSVATDYDYYLHKWARYAGVPYTNWTKFFQENSYPPIHYDDIMMRYEHPGRVIAYPGNLDMNSRVAATVRKAVAANLEVKIFREEHDPSTWATPFPTVILSYEEVFK